jgi:hypothetical protein
MEDRIKYPRTFNTTIVEWNANPSLTSDWPIKYIQIYKQKNQ